uniref:Uncharacterized protein n=1 Tax=Cacopsylla melanoneura TaxID=428564 RepID=A0A8D9BVK1_9HEMI
MLYVSLLMLYVSLFETYYYFPGQETFRLYCPVQCFCSFYMVLQLEAPVCCLSQILELIIFEGFLHFLLVQLTSKISKVLSYLLWPLFKGVDRGNFDFQDF